VRRNANQIESIHVLDRIRRRRCGNRDNRPRWEVDRREALAGDAPRARGGKQIRKPRLLRGTQLFARKHLLHRHPLHAEILFVDQHRAVGQLYRRNLAGARHQFGCLERLGHMQLAWTAVIEHAIRQIAVLLRLKNDRARPDGMHSARIDKDHLAGGNRFGMQALLQRACGDLRLHLMERHSWLQAHRQTRPGLCRQRIPALGLAARGAILLRHRVIGMHLHAEFVGGKQHLHQQGRSRLGRIGTKQRRRMLRKNHIKALACQRAAPNKTHIAGQPCLANQRLVVSRHLVKPGKQIAKAPRAYIKTRFNSKRSQTRQFTGHGTHPFATGSVEQFQQRRRALNTFLSASFHPFSL